MTDTRRSTPQVPPLSDSTSLAALTTGAALVSRSDRGVIRVTGADRATWLQGLLTNDVVALDAGRGCYSAWLTPQGRMITDAVVLAEEDAITLEVPGSIGEDLYRRLDAAIFAEDVLLTDECGVWTSLGVHGARAAHDRGSHPAERHASAAQRRDAETLAGWPEFANTAIERRRPAVSSRRLRRARVRDPRADRRGRRLDLAAASRWRRGHPRRRGRVRADRSRTARVPHRHGGRHDPARSRDRGSGHLLHQGLLRGPGGDRARRPPGRADGWRAASSACASAMRACQSPARRSGTRAATSATSPAPRGHRGSRHRSRSATCAASSSSRARPSR